MPILNIPKYNITIMLNLTQSPQDNEMKFHILSLLPHNQTNPHMLNQKTQINLILKTIPRTTSSNHPPGYFSKSHIRSHHIRPLKLTTQPRLPGTEKISSESSNLAKGSLVIDTRRIRDRDQFEKSTTSNPA